MNGQTRITISSLINNPESIISSPIGLNTLNIVKINDPDHADKTCYNSPYININNITNNSFTMNVQNLNYTQGGISFIAFANNLASMISKFDLPYIIDFGEFDVSTYIYLQSSTNHTNYTNIPFNFTFPSTPTVILSCNLFNCSGVNQYVSDGYMINTQLGTISIGISAIYQYYYTLDYNYNQVYEPVQIPYQKCYWIAILKNPNSSSSSLPYAIDFGEYQINENNLQGIPYSLQNVNGKENSKIYGMIDFTTKFSKPPVVILGNLLFSIDTITNNYFHMNYIPQNLQTNNITTTNPMSVYYLSWIAIELPNIIDNPLFTCPSTTYVDYCPSTITTPSSIELECHLNTINYLSINKNNIFSEISVYSPSSSPSLAGLNLPDVVYCNIDVSKANKLATNSNIVCFIISQNFNTDISGQMNATIDIHVNTDYGFFSKCSSFGNVFLRITTSFASTDILTVNFTNIGLNENFQYYVQWGYADDDIFGPFTTTYSNTFGHPKCSDFNVQCLVNETLQYLCKDSLKLLKIDGTPINQLNEGICEQITSYLGLECEAAVGGPEDFIGDAFCADGSISFEYSCNKALDAGEDFAIDELCTNLFPTS
jgi:hypothetical protein